MSSKRRIFFYGKTNCWSKHDFDYPLYINESNQCRSMLLFIYRSDADEWTRNYKMMNSSYGSQRRLYLAWEITSCDYKDCLRVTWLPMVTNFISGVCKTSTNLCPSTCARRYTKYAQMKMGLPRIQWPPVFKLTGGVQRELKLAHGHDWVGRPL